MNLEDLRLFVTTLEAGSFTAAAERLGVSKQFVSRRITALEQSLGVRLLNRTTRHLQPTELGLMLQTRARLILEEVEATRELIASRSSEARGMLRVSAPMSFGTLHLGPLLADFMRRHPLIQLELELDDRAVDLVGDGYDMSLRIGVLEDSSLIAQRLASVRMALCASPGYLAEHPAPQHPRELAQHACLLYGHSRQVEWRFQADGRALSVSPRGNLRSNNGEVIRDAALGGAGIAYLPTFIVGQGLREGRLVALLETFVPPGDALYAVYPQHRVRSRVVQVFVDYLRECFA